MFDRALLAGRVAVVTGSAGGIGAAAAVRMAEHGAAVALLDRDPDGLAQVGADLRARGHRCVELPVDVSDGAAVDVALHETARELGGVDVLVNNAGVGRAHALENLDPGDWERMLAVNLTGPCLCTKAALPWLKASRHASVVMVSSLAAKRGSHHGGVGYTASKAGLLGFSKHLAYELAAYGIRVNVICPGPVLTPMVEAVTSPEDREATRRMLPLRRWVTTEDVANAILYFASDASRGCAGSDLDVDSGMSVVLQPFPEYFAHRGVSYPSTSSDEETGHVTADHGPGPR